MHHCGFYEVKYSKMAQKNICFAFPCPEIESIVRSSEDYKLSLASLRLGRVALYSLAKPALSLIGITINIIHPNFFDREELYSGTYSEIAVSSEVLIATIVARLSTTLPKLPLRIFCMHPDT